MSSHEQSVGVRIRALALPSCVMLVSAPAPSSSAASWSRFEVDEAAGGWDVDALAGEALLDVSPAKIPRERWPLSVDLVSIRLRSFT